VKKIIYDFGSNCGDNIPYYLKKCDLVVAVEADPSLCAVIQSRFSDEIRLGKLAVENFVLTDQEKSTDVFFYRHKVSRRSQFPKPRDITNFETILLPSKSVSKLISEYGEPYYIKIDIEHYDEVILRCLFQNGIKPAFISAESHSIEVFALLVAHGGYNAFNLVEGKLVSSSYRDHQISTTSGTERYSFPHHSAGPFGDDIIGPWMTANNFHRLLTLSGLGWKDVHASNVIQANDSSSVGIFEFFAVYFKNKIVEAIRALTPKIFRSSIH